MIHRSGNIYDGNTHYKKIDFADLSQCYDVHFVNTLIPLRL